VGLLSQLRQALEAFNDVLESAEDVLEVNGHLNEVGGSLYKSVHVYLLGRNMK